MDQEEGPPRAEAAFSAPSETGGACIFSCPVDRYILHRISMCILRAFLQACSRHVRALYAGVHRLRALRVGGGPSVRVFMSAMQWGVEERTKGME